MSKITLILKRLLIYGAIVALIIPAAASTHDFLGTITRIEKAQAAEKKPLAGTKTIVKEIETPPVLEATKGLNKDMTYLAGEKINLTLTFASKSPMDVWAKLDNLDPSFAERKNLTNQGDGSWHLSTPVLTDRLNVGSQNLEIFTQNSSGILPLSFTLNLQPRIISNLAVKTGLGPDTINLSWTSFKSAKYLVEWSVQDAQSINVKVAQEPRTVLTKLLPNTIYEVKISAFNNSGEKIASKELEVKTLTLAGKQIAGIEQPKPIKTVTPAIGEGVSTVAPQVAQKQPSTISNSEPTPTPSPSPTPKEEEKTGWSRLLIALAILVIAAGAAVGGYYTYEWYASKSGDREPPESKSNSRW